MSLNSDSLEAWSKRDRFINESLASFDKRIKKIEKRLLETIIEDYITRFQFDQSGLLPNERNTLLAGALDEIMDEFTEEFQKAVLFDIGTGMAGLTAMSKEYFEVLKFDAKKLNNIENKLSWLRSRIGLDVKGNFIRDGWLHRIGESAEVRNELKNYVLNAVTNKTSLKEFQSGFKDLIIGREDIGTLQRHYKQIVHDTFFTVERFNDKEFAEELGLGWFVYEGSLIDTSREFCIEKAGKVFSVEAAQEWADEDWRGKSDPYDPIVDLGGYNCRHNARWIPEELAKELINESD